MTLASGALHQLYYIPEVTFGTTPTSPAWTPFRNKGCTLGLKRDSLESQELRSYRAITDLRLGTYKVDGDVDCELIKGAFDTMLEALMGGTWTANVLKQGVTARSFAMLRRFTDVTQYQEFNGVVPAKLALSVKSNAMVDAKFSFLGSNMVLTPTGSATYNSANANMPLDSFSGTFKEGGATIAFLAGIDLTIDNGLEPNYVLGSKYAAAINWGLSKITGTAKAYFPDATLITKFLNETASSMEFTLSDGTNTLNFLMSNLKYTTGDIPASNEKSLELSLGFAALHHSTDTNLKITRSA